MSAASAGRFSGLFSSSTLFLGIFGIRLLEGAEWRKAASGSTGLGVLENLGLGSRFLDVSSLFFASASSFLGLGFFLSLEELPLREELPLLELVLSPLDLLLSLLLELLLSLVLSLLSDLDFLFGDLSLCLESLLLLLLLSEFLPLLLLLLESDLEVVLFSESCFLRRLGSLLSLLESTDEEVVVAS